MFINQRTCSANSKAFSALKTYYENRDQFALDWKASGKKVAGTLGCDVPDEILLAAGILPVRAHSDPAAGLAEADKYLEFSFDPVVRSQFERLVDGTGHKLYDRLVISNSTDVLIRIYFYLREIQRVEPEKSLPPITFIDWLFTRFMMHQERNERIIKAFAAQVAEWAGRQISDEELRQSCSVCNENRAALREFADLRCGGDSCVTGTEALTVIGAGMFIDKQRHTQLVRELIGESRTWPKVDGHRIFMTGSPQEDTTLYGLIESAGMNVVSEDHDWGARHMDRDVDLSMEPVAGIVDRYMLRTPSSKKAFVKERVDALCSSVEKCGAQGVIFYMNIYDEAASWDYPSQKEALDKMGIPSLMLAVQPYPIGDDAELSKALGAFAQQLKGGK